MFNHLKRYVTFALGALLLNTAVLFPNYLMATQEVFSQDETAQSTKNNEQSDESDENEIKKPTFTESWRKVITLRWKELTKADAWNISAPIVGIAALGAWYYWPKNIIVGNDNHNQAPNNPGIHPHVSINNDNNRIATDNHIDNFELSVDLSSEDDLNGNPDDLILLVGINELLPEVQTKIAFYRYAEFVEIREKKERSIINKLRAKDEEIIGEVAYAHDDVIRNLKKQKKILLLENKYTLHLMRTAIFKIDFHLYIQYNLTIPQVDLLTRAWNITRKNQYFIIHCLSEDGKVFLTFDKQVRKLLLQLFKIELKIEND